MTGGSQQVEVWLPVLGYHGIYDASNLGRIRRRDCDPMRIIKPIASTGDYHIVTLSKDGVSRNQRVSRIVLTAFCGPPPFDGAHAAHNDGIKSNNSLTNLRWATPVENQADVSRHGNRCVGERVFGAVLTADRVRQIRARCAIGERSRPIAEDFGVSSSTVHLIRHNRIWKHVA